MIAQCRQFFELRFFVLVDLEEQKQMRSQLKINDSEIAEGSLPNDILLHQFKLDLDLVPGGSQLILPVFVVNQCTERTLQILDDAEICLN